MDGARHSTAFTAAYLSAHGPQDSETLRLAGAVLAASASERVPDRSEGPQARLFRRLLLAAREVEALGLFLDETAASVDSDNPPALVALATAAYRSVGPLHGVSAGLRLACLAPEPEVVPPPADPVMRLQDVLRAFAAALRPWGPPLRAAIRRLGPPAEEGAEETYQQWFIGLAEFVISDTAETIAHAEALAEVTEDTVDDYDPDAVGERGFRTWREIDPGAPR